MIALLLAAVASPAPVQQLPAGMTTRVAAAVVARDAAPIGRAADVLLVWTKSLTTEKFDYDVIDPAEAFRRTVGCTGEWVSERDGEFKLACRDKPVAGERCFDQALVGFVRRGPSSGSTIVRFQKDKSWSTARCGKAPLFAPPAPPMTGKK